MLATSSSDDEDYDTRKKPAPNATFKSPPGGGSSFGAGQTQKANPYFSQPNTPNISQHRYNNNSNASTVNAMANMNLTNGVGSSGSAGDTVSIRSSFSTSNENINRAAAGANPYGRSPNNTSMHNASFKR